MALAIEINSSVGVKEDNVQYGWCRKWIIPISAHATIHLDESKPPTEIGKALGFIILRSAFGSNFHETMESPHKGTMDLALDLFDRYGRIKEEIYKHSLRRGSGVWEKELNDGNLVLIEDVYVESKYRRKCVGSKLVLHILEQAMRPLYNVAYAFAGAAAYYNDDGGGEDAGSSSRLHHTKIEGVVSFLRSLQFRRVGLTSWFALARDREHPSRRLARDKDPDPKPELDDLIESDSDEEVIQCNPDFTQTKHKKSEWNALWLGASPRQKPAITSRKRPLHYAMKTLPDKDALVFLKSHTRDGVLEEFPLDALDGRGDTVLHAAAKASKPKCLAWLLAQSIITTFLSADNYAGYTPLEALQAQLEARRVHIPFGFERVKLIGDKFEGFNEDSVMCLCMLQGVKEPSKEQRMRVKFGCSCNECFDGFLSPRMLKKLRQAAQIQYEHLIGLTPSDQKDWYMVFQDLLSHFPQSFRSEIRAKKSLQTSFVTVMGAVANCLAEKNVPRKASVIESLRATRLGVAIETLYFRRGGTVAAAVGAIFDEAKLLDPELSDGLKEKELEKYYKGSPKCRNDLEFEFVRRRCADDALPENEAEKPLSVPMPWLAQMFRQTLEGKNFFENIDI